MNDDTNDPIGEEPTDDAFGRLQDSDPAAGLTADLDRIKAEVDARTGPPVRTGWRWSQIAAAVIAVALVGAGGYFIGQSSGAGRPDSADSVAAGATQTVTADGGGVAIDVAPVPGSAEAAAVPGRAPDAAGGAAAQSAAAGDAKSMYTGYRTVFTDGGLSTDRGSGQAWAFDASQTVSAATAERIAATLGVSGSAVAMWGSWNVGSSDGSGPTLQLMSDGTASFSFWDPTVPTMDCPMVEPEATAAASTAEIMPQPCTAPADVTALEADTAVARSKELVSSLGLDPATFEFEAMPTEPGQIYASVNAYPLVGGSRINQAWSISFSGDRLAGAYGQLAPVIEAGQYPVISPAEAVARLNDPRFGASGPMYPIDYPWPTEPGIGTEQPSDTVTTPPAPATGGPIAWPVSQVTITGAALGVDAQYQPDGTVLLLPTYTLTDGSGAYWTVIAVTDDQLDFTSQ